MQIVINMKSKERQLFREALMEWYRVNQRDLPWRKFSDPYAIWVSEVMLQQTQVNTVVPYYNEFLKRFPNIERLAQADLQDVLKAWEGMGYYARARNLHKAAGMVLNHHRGMVPRNWKDFHELPGVGDYIAAAVLSIAFRAPFAVVDGNVKRVLSRLFLIEEPVNRPASKKIFQQPAAGLLSVNNPGTFNQAVMELGALVCKPNNPRCPECPVQTWCRAHQTNRTMEFPKRLKKQATPQYRIAVGVVFRNHRVLITRRKPDGLLGGMWEFPGGKIRQNEKAEAACIREIREEVNLAVKIDSHLCRVKHAYTHFKIQMEVFCCSYISGRVRLNGPVDHLWIRLNQLQQYPLPKANHKFLSQLNDWYCEGGKTGIRK